MKAIIKLSSKKIFNIYIFAIFDKGWNAQVVYFDCTSGKLEVDKLYTTGKYGATRKVFIVDMPKSGWISQDKDENLNGKCSSGYKWFLN